MMSSWYSKMYRSHEVARERNRREQRRMDLDRHGPLFIAKYSLANLDQERRMVERELERIRKGIHKQPKLSEIRTRKGSDVNNNGGKNEVNDSDPQNKDTPYKINGENSKEENKLYEAMIFLQNNPSALVPIISAHGESDSYLKTLEKIAPAISDEPEPFVPSYLKNSAVDKREKSLLLEKYKVLLQRHSPILRQNSPLLSRKYGGHTHAQTSSIEREASDEQRQTDSPRQEVSPLLSQLDKEKLGLADHGDEKHTGEHSPLSSRTRRQPELHELANGGMENARENVNRRLSVSGVDSRISDESSGSKKQADNAPKATKAATLFPDFDPEYYNPDGTLRTQHAMPEFKERWKEAERTRYVRTRDQREMDRELSINEIFGDNKK